MASPDIQAPAPLAAAPPVAKIERATSGGTGGFSPFGEDGFTFGDLLDILNPLQHIPVVGTIYRKITGDSIDPAARLAGGALFGGAIGAAVAGVNAVLEDATGKDAGEHVLALFESDAQAPAATAVAAPAEPPAPLPDLAQLAPLAAPTTHEGPPIDLAALSPLSPAAVLAVASAAEPAPAGSPAASRDTLPPGTLPPGAMATEGGWFTQTMLAALEKYQDSARLAAGPAGEARTAHN